MMTKNPTSMAVVAGAIADGRGRWLLQKRPAGKRHAGLWEFPGGKVEPGENPRQALVREVNEELTITVSACGIGPIAQASAEAGEGEPAVVISLYTIDAWEGAPSAEPGAEIAWFTPDEIATLPLPPLDAQLAGQLFEAMG
jgi:8-oxo-dGTP diphosphatase